MSSKKSLGLLSGLLIALAQAGAAEYFVSTQGADSNRGTLDSPFQTITHAYGLARPGDIVTVMPGVYYDYSRGWGLHLGSSGTASSPITVRSQVRGAAVIDGQNGSDRNVAVYLDGHYNILDGFEIRGGTKAGIKVWGGSNQVLNNDIHHNGTVNRGSGNGQDGLYSSPEARDNLYQGNYVHDNGRQGSNLDHGFYLCGSGESVINNVLIRNAATGLQVAGYSTVRNLKIYNNVVAYNGTSGIVLWMALDGIEIKNNILYGNGSYGINSWEAHGGGVEIESNLLSANSSGEYNLRRGNSDFDYSLGSTISRDPLFVDSSRANFDPRLKKGSPAIGAGVNLSGLFGIDMGGLLRTISGGWDVGAHGFEEEGGGAPPAGAVGVRWPSIPGMTYVVEYSEEVDGEIVTWQSEEILATGPVTEWIDTTAGETANRFYSILAL